MLGCSKTDIFVTGDLKCRMKLWKSSDELKDNFKEVKHQTCLWVNYSLCVVLVIVQSSDALKLV